MLLAARLEAAPFQSRYTRSAVEAALSKPHPLIFDFWTAEAAVPHVISL